MKYFKIFYIFLLLTFFFISCKQSGSSDRGDMEKLILQTIYIETNAVYSDCVYCTKPQNDRGICTCYSQIKMGSCPGVSSGEYKSNSYRVTCSKLTSKGKWHKLEETSTSSSCTHLTCPPDAYENAFGKEEF